MLFIKTVKGKMKKREVNSSILAFANYMVLKNQGKIYGSFVKFSPSLTYI